MAEGAANPEKTEPSTPGVGARLLQALTGSTPEKKVDAIPPNILAALKQNNTALNLLVGKLDKFVTNQEEKDDGTGEEAKQALKTEKPKSFILADVDEKALEKVKKLFEGLGLGEKSAKAAVTATSPDKKGSGNGFDLKKILGSALMAALPLAAILTGIAGSLALAIGSWFNQGPFKGLMKEAGLRASELFLKLVKPAFGILEKLAPTFAERIMKAFTGMTSLFKSGAGKIALQFSKLLPTLAKFLGPILKRLPVIGTIINIGSAVSRFMAGDVIGGLIDLGSAIAVLIPGVGTAISIGLGFLNAARDLTGETEKSKAGGGNADKSFISTMVIGFGKWAAKLLPKLKFIPVLGGLFSLYEAYDYFKKGNIVQGILGLVSGIASFIPGAGTIVSLVSGGVNILLDLITSNEQKPSKDGKKEPAKPGIMKMANDWIKEKATKVFSGAFGMISKGWEAIKKGAVILGLVAWSSFIPALAWIEPVYNWLMGTPETIKEDGEKEPAQPGILSKAWSWVKEKVKTKLLFPALVKLATGWQDLQKGNILKGLYTWATLIPGFSWLGGIVSWLLDSSVEDPKEEAVNASEKLDANTIYEVISKGVREKFKAILENLKKLSFVPNFVVDKIADFLGIDLNAKAEPAISSAAPEAPKAVSATIPAPEAPKAVSATIPAPEAPKAVSATIPTGALPITPKVEPAASLAIPEAPKAALATIPTGALPVVATSSTAPDTSWTAAPLPITPATPIQPVVSSSETLIQANTDKNKETLEVGTKNLQKIENEKMAPYTGETVDVNTTQATDSGKSVPVSNTQSLNKPDDNTVYPSVMRNTKADIPLRPNTEPRVPLQSEATITESSGFNITKKLDELIAAIQTLNPSPRGNNNAASINSSTGGSNITNVFNNGTERDIPYTERTKYRNQLMYARSLL